MGLDSSGLWLNWAIHRLHILNHLKPLLWYYVMLSVSPWYILFVVNMFTKFGLCNSLVKKETCIRDVAQFCQKWVFGERGTHFSRIYLFNRSSRCYFMRAGSLTASQCHCRRDNGIIAHRNLLLKLYSLQLGEPKLLCTTRHCFASNRDERLTIESDLIQKYLHSLLEEYTDRRSSANRNMAELEAVVSRFILYQQKKEEISELNRMITGLLLL